MEETSTVEYVFTIFVALVIIIGLACKLAGWW